MDRNNSEVPSNSGCFKYNLSHTSIVQSHDPFDIPTQHQSVLSTAVSDSQSSSNNRVSDKDIIASLMSEIQGLRAQLSSIINEHQAQLEAQRKQHELTLSLIQAAFPNNEDLAAIFGGNNNDDSHDSQMEVDDSKKTKRRRSVENGGNGDYNTKVLINTAAGTIVDGRFIHGKRVAQANLAVLQQTNVPELEVAKSPPKMLNKASVNEHGSGEDTPETEPFEDNNRSDNGGNDKFQIVTRKKKAAAKDKPDVKETVNKKMTKTTKETAPCQIKMGFQLSRRQHQRLSKNRHQLQWQHLVRKSWKT